MDTTLITSTAAVLALGGFAIAEVRVWKWRRAAGRRQELLNWLHGKQLEALALANKYRRERDALLNADIDAGIARQRELRLKRSQAALKGHQTRRQANG